MPNNKTPFIRFTCNLQEKIRVNDVKSQKLSVAVLIIRLQLWSMHTSYIKKITNPFCLHKSNTSYWSWSGNRYYQNFIWPTVSELGCIHTATSTNAGICVWVIVNTSLHEYHFGWVLILFYNKASTGQPVAKLGHLSMSNMVASRRLRFLECESCTIRSTVSENPQ